MPLSNDGNGTTGATTARGELNSALAALGEAIEKAMEAGMTQTEVQSALMQGMTALMTGQPLPER